jgi:serine/threonine protein kinase
MAPAQQPDAQWPPRVPSTGASAGSGSNNGAQMASPRANLTGGAGAAGGSAQLAAQLAQLAAHAHAAQSGGQPQPQPQPQHPEQREDDVVRQQLLALALRACRAGGTGVGEGQGMPVGLSELYKLGKAIGEGAFGFVRVAQQRLSRELIAVKTFEKVRLKDQSSRRRLENEIRVLQRIRHPSIVRLYEVFESPKRIHLCMEHVSHGTLHRHLTQHKRLPEGEVRRLVRQLVGALSYLHARSIAHRDIKLENVLLDEWCNVRLIDFGFSILSRGRLRVPCGSPAYTAPEILLAHEYDGQLADVWSLGVLIYVMLAGRFPFQGATRAELSRNVLRGSFASPSGLSREPESLLRRILVLDPNQRYTIDNVRAHPWMQRRSNETEIVTEHEVSGRADPATKEQMVSMGLPIDVIEQSLATERHDHVHTTYLLLQRRKPRVQTQHDERGPLLGTPPAPEALMSQKEANAPSQLPKDGVTAPRPASANAQAHAPPTTAAAGGAVNAAAAAQRPVSVK